MTRLFAKKHCLNLSLRLFGTVMLAHATFTFASNSGSIQFKSCYAQWEDSGLVVGNAKFERKWSIQNGMLKAISFRIKNPDVEWLLPPRNLGPSLGGILRVSATTERFNSVEADSLKLNVAVLSRVTNCEVMEIFPDASGIVIQQELRNEQGQPSARLNKADDVEKSDESAAVPTVFESADDLLLAPEHLRMTQVTFEDQTDHHNELVFEREWLLAPCEDTIKLSGNLIFLENTLTGSGLVILKLAPLPRARPMKTDADFIVTARSHLVQVKQTGYPEVVLSYSGGRSGRIAALQDLQRQLRAPDMKRDAVFLSNTWGDRFRDAHINQAFILKEIEAGKRLGVDVVQIDDGWQTGRTKNSAAEGGIWGGWWEANPLFWLLDSKRFPDGLEPLVEAARNHGMKIGLWFAPDSSKNAVNWRRDADCILKLHRNFGIDYFKIDSLKTPTVLAAVNQRRLFDSIINESQGNITLDLDVTADDRPGYFGFPEIGPVFIENRYTDAHTYWPHQTLRNLWKLSQYIDPVRLRVEFLNNTRNAMLYSDDPLAPCKYPPDTLFAETMFASPLGWLEVSALPESFMQKVAPLVTVWKRERTKLYAGHIIPIGGAPDGIAWTGFASISSAKRSGYVLLFRELNQDPRFDLNLDDLLPENVTSTILAGRGSVGIKNRQLQVCIPKSLDFLWIRLDSVNSTDSSATPNQAEPSKGSIASDSH